MPNCPSCAKKIEEEKFIEKYLSPFNNQEYKLYHCSKCNLEWWEPLKIIPSFYEKNGNELYETLHFGVRKKIGENHKMFFKHISLKTGKLLDVGCGDGVFLKEAKKLGYEIYGIDFDKKNIEVAKRNLRIETVYPLSLEEFYHFAGKRNLKFDVITFFEVLEHQDRPREFLMMIKDLLKEDGFIAGSVPRRESTLINFYRTLENPTDLPPHHFLRFDEKSLNYLFNLVGFEINLFPVHFSLFEMFGFPDFLFGKFFKKIKISMKKKLAPQFSVSYPVKALSNTSKKFILLKTMRITKNILFFPLQIMFFVYQYFDPLQIYFQGKK